MEGGELRRPFQGTEHLLPYLRAALWLESRTGFGPKYIILQYLQYTTR